MKAIQGLFSLVGCHLRRLTSIPFGEDWLRDIAFFENGSSLDVIFDVGANIGQTAQDMSGRHPTSRIYSFEPVPSTFDQLKSGTSHLANVEVHCAALSDEEGFLQMTSDPGSVSNRIVSGNGDEAGLKTVEVKVDTVDAFCARKGIKHINLLKIDTEGYEMNVLRGAKEILSRGDVDFVIAECEFVRRPSEPHGPFADIAEFLLARGYRIVSFYTGGVDEVGWVWGDVLFRKVSEGRPRRVSVSPMLTPRVGI